ncbi:MAG: hypothetical protein ACR2L0_05555 [Gaiellaceae bacterium]
MVYRKLLGIYLNDHLGGSAAGLALVRRCLRANRGTELGSFLEGLAREIEEDRHTLIRLMVRLDFKRSAAKQVAGLVAERVGRLKLNGRLTGYSDLSRLLELEGLTIGVRGKHALWENLRTAGIQEHVPEIELDRLVERAESQLSGLERHRLGAAVTALRN